MSTSTETARSDVLLVGSLPFETAEEAFRAAAQGLRGHVGWLPDGEVAERTNWVGMLPLVVFPKNPDLEETLAPAGELEQPDRDAARPPVEDLAGIWCWRVDSTRVAERAKQAGVQVDLEVWDEMVHVWHVFAKLLPEAQQAIEKVGSYVIAHTS